MLNSKQLSHLLCFWAVIIARVDLMRN